MKWIIYLYIDYTHRIRIYTEEKAKAVAGVWGTKCIQFLVALAILHQDNLKNRMNSSFSSYHSGAIHPFPHIILVSEKLVQLNIEKILSPKQQRRPLPSLLSLSFFYAVGKVFILFSNTLGSGGDRDYDDANYPNL